MGKKSRIAPQRIPTKRQLSRWQREARVQRLTIIAGAIAIFIILAIPLFGYAREYVFKGREAVARVNQATLSLSDYSKLLNLNSFEMEQQINSLQSSAGQSADQSQGILQYFEQARASLPGQVVDQWIKDRLVGAEASALGVAVTPGEIDEAIRPTSDPNAPEGEGNQPLSDEDFQKGYNDFLSRANTTDALYRQVLGASLLQKKVSNRLAEGIKSPAQQVHVQAILVATEDEAKTVLDRLGKGEDFAQVASEVSDDAQSRNNGGDMGWLPRGVLDQELEDAVFPAPVGQLGGPVESAQGFTVFKVSERADSREIEPAAMDKVKANVFDRWLEQARRDSKVEDYLTSDKIAWAQKQIKRR